MGLLAVAVVGTDRSALIPEVSGVLARAGTEICEASMTLLGGYAVMMLLVSGGPSAEELRGRVALVPGVLSAVVGLPEHGSDSVLPAASQEEFELSGDPRGLPYVLTAHGPARSGVLAAVGEVIAEVGGHITALSVRRGGRLHAMVADLRIPGYVDVAHLMRTLTATCADLGSEISFRPAREEIV
ncbi:glycine cleavage system transcriptional repressor [Sinosporangium album]|uniref:Glycine cleavage system transcriptional repressor n=1 Tax=Sinosporangium album TaxID=504805 RepID=A0A1G8AKG9_9ACTN|nr:ACT domain-containing protein [Sinosporangium album]SDH21343.1 glycine cleavage system transcriptional repressor [Sinosporangium album]